MISCWAHRLTNKLSENTKKKEGKKEKKKEGRMGERERGKRRLSGGMLVLNYNLHQLPSHWYTAGLHKMLLGKVFYTIAHRSHGSTFESSERTFRSKSL